MPMSPRLLRPRSTLHPAAADWRNRVLTNGGTVSGTTLNAVSKFCRDIDAAGIRDKFYRLNLFCGDQLAAALVPLYRAESLAASARGNTTDTNNNFVSGDYNNTGSSAGLLGNGTTKFLNTGFAANTLPATNSHLGIGVLATSTGLTFRSGIGAYNNGDHSYEIMMRNTSAGTQRPGVFTRFGTATDRCGDNIGFSGANLPVGNNLAAYPTFYRNGVAVGDNATTSADYPSAHSIYVFAVSWATTNNPALNHANARLGWYSIGATMTASQALAFHNALSTFNAALSRT